MRVVSRGGCDFFFMLTFSLHSLMVHVLLVKQGGTTQFGTTSKMTDIMMSVDGPMLWAKGGVC